MAQGMEMSAIDSLSSGNVASLGDGQLNLRLEERLYLRDMIWQNLGAIESRLDERDAAWTRLDGWCEVTNSFNRRFPARHVKAHQFVALWERMKNQALAKMAAVKASDEAKESPAGKNDGGVAAKRKKLKTHEKSAVGGKTTPNRKRKTPEEEEVAATMLSARKTRRQKQQQRSAVGRDYPPIAPQPVWPPPPPASGDGVVPGSSSATVGPSDPGAGGPTLIKLMEKELQKNRKILPKEPSSSSPPLNRRSSPLAKLRFELLNEIAMLNYGPDGIDDHDEKPPPDVGKNNGHPPPADPGTGRRSRGSPSRRGSSSSAWGEKYISQKLSSERTKVMSILQRGSNLGSSSQEEALDDPPSSVPPKLPADQQHTENVFTCFNDDRNAAPATTPPPVKPRAEVKGCADVDDDDSKEVERSLHALMKVHILELHEARMKLFKLQEHKLKFEIACLVTKLDKEFQ